ncbi:hypothetical protein V2J09_016049 [Rumex salicifolius]
MFIRMRKDNSFANAILVEGSRNFLKKLLDGAVERQQSKRAHHLLLRATITKRKWKSSATHISDTFFQHREAKEPDQDVASEGQDGVSNYAVGSKSTAEYDLEFEKEHVRGMSMEELLRETRMLWLKALGGDKKGKMFGQRWLYRKDGHVLNRAALHLNSNLNLPHDIAVSLSPPAPNAWLSSPSSTDAAAQLVASTTT